MKSEKQMLKQYLAERDDLAAKRAVLDARLSALDSVIVSLRVLLGEATPKPARTSQATGTKAVILDVLADGKPRKLAALADECKVSVSSLRPHIVALVKAGDVSATGNTSQRVYVVR